MNVIVANKQKEIIDNANIDAIKDFNGLFNVDDLINKFANYFFSKIILDATSVVNFTSKEVLEKLVNAIGAERLVILLPQGEEPPKKFTDMLINLKIYNFSTKIEDIVKFINNPNTYENITSSEGEVKESFYVDSSIKANENFSEAGGSEHLDMVAPTNDTVINDAYNEYAIEGENDNADIITDTIDTNPMPDIRYDENTNINTNGTNIFTPIIENEANNTNVVQEDVINHDASYYNVDLNHDTNSNINTNNVNNTIPVIDSGFYSSMETNNTDSTNQGMLVEDNTNKMMNNNVPNNNFYGNTFLNVNNNRKVIGVRNVTLHAGSTTLIYLIKKVLEEKFHKSAFAVEVNKSDFKYFNEKGMISSNSNDLHYILSNVNADVVLVDLNDYYGSFDLFNDMLYLVEPSVIKLNALMMNNRFAFRELGGKKIILNKSMLSPNDVHALSKEAGVQMFMNIGPLNDRVSNDVIIDLIKKIGL